MAQTYDNSAVDADIINRTQLAFERVEAEVKEDVQRLNHNLIATHIDYPDFRPQSSNSNKSEK
jgi:hypothetical protein